MLKASAETLGMLAMLNDFGWNISGEVWGDASAAMGIISRIGLGKTRHIDTSLLWIQQTAAEKRLRYEKVLGKLNPADLCTKHFDANTMDGHVRRLAFEVAVGRAMEAPKLHLRTSGEEAEWEMCKHVKMVIEALGKDKATRKYQKVNGRELVLAATSSTVSPLTRKHLKERIPASHEARRGSETHMTLLTDWLSQQPTHDRTKALASEKSKNAPLGVSSKGVSQRDCVSLDTQAEKSESHHHHHHQSASTQRLMSIVYSHCYQNITRWKETKSNMRFHWETSFPREKPVRGALPRKCGCTQLQTQ